MVDRIYVHPHARKHGLTDAEIAYAWEHYLYSGHRVVPDREMRIGFSRFGREIEMVGVRNATGILIIHAMSPATKRMLNELGME